MGTITQRESNNPQLPRARPSGTIGGRQKEFATVGMSVAQASVFHIIANAPALTVGTMMRQGTHGCTVTPATDWRWLMRTQPRLMLQVVRHLVLAAALTTLAAAEVRGQSGVIESWRDSAGNWTGQETRARLRGQPAGRRRHRRRRHHPGAEDTRRPASSSGRGSTIPPERVVSYWIATDFARQRVDRRRPDHRIAELARRVPRPEVRPAGQPALRRRRPSAAWRCAW